MKPDAVVVICALVTIFGSCWHHVTAFITAPHTSPQSSAISQPSRVAESATGMGLMAVYSPAAAAAAANGYMNDDGSATGSVSFQQTHDPNLSEANERMANVYDPGDELLRALNAEITANGQELGTLPEEPDYADTVFNELEVASKYDMLRKLENDLREEQDIVTKSALLMKLLEDPSIDTLPVVYVEGASLEGPLQETDEQLYSLGNNGMAKRSRYYRRYPWKRHNRNRSTYEPELRYACTPSKEDVFKLLINLHENRKGNHSKTVNFCNRKRPAKAIFTNIRFLG